MNEEFDLTRQDIPKAMEALRLQCQSGAPRDIVHRRADEVHAIIKATVSDPVLQAEYLNHLRGITGRT
jgi:hypothetical protein